ncbi:MAG: heavy metal-responsive transcriptional regulator [Segniliparus sp.]|uniref:heavy metal-responsive transcriptional regulator n=1 Tax=Segniliparus sp. TaxID=2804064 RepID=UPI003F2DE7DB
MKIGEIAAAGGVTAKTIRFYEQIGVLPEPGRARNGYRDYSSETVKQIEFIRLAQSAGLSLHEIRDVFAIRSAGAAPCGHVQDMLAARLGQVHAKMAELSVLAERLAALLDNAKRAKPADTGTTVCWIIEGCSGQSATDSRGQ